MPLGLLFGHHKGVKLVVGQAEGERVACLTRCFSSHDAAVYSKVRRHWKHLNEGRSLDPVSEASTRTHGPVPFASYPVHAGSWDGDGARKRMRAAASSDGSGDWDKVDCAEYARGFAYVAGDGEKPSDYKLPHHDVIDGKWVTVPRGVEAAIAAVDGARGGADIPADDLPAVKTHLGKESQHALDRPAPWDRTELADETPADLTLLDGEPSAIPLPRVGGNPPTRLLAFKWGANLTTKGTLYLTPEGAQRAKEAFAKRGVRLAFDYFHSTYNPAVAPADRKAAGTCLLGFDGEGAWYEEIQWTPPAAKSIRDGEWPYYSPGVMHDKAGVIFEFKNPGLVTDPGTIAARPLVLANTPEGQMADKKRLMLDAYSAGQTYLRCLQAMADSDGQEKDLGNEAISVTAKQLQGMATFARSAGYMSDADMAMESAKEARGKAGEKMLATLEAQFGETDPDKLEGKLLAKLLSNAPAAAATEVDAMPAKLMLLDSYANRYPAAKRDELAKLSLTALVTLLQASPEIVPNATPAREAPPAPPTVTQLREDTKTMSTPTEGAKFTTLAACDPPSRAKVQDYVEVRRAACEAAGVKFDEALATDEGLALLSDAAASPLVGNEIRHLPVQAAALPMEG